MRILFAAGGTAGHINPAIAVAEYMRDENKGHEFLFAAVPGGMEEILVSKAGFAITPIKIKGIQRRLTLENIRRLTMIPAAMRRGNAIIREFKPDVVFATGGYLSFPIVKAAKRHGIPYILHESNALPGATVKLLSKSASYVLLNHPTTAQYLNSKCHTAYVGNPLRADFKMLNKAEARRKLGISDGLFMILSFGGSLGAEKINQVCIQTMKTLLSEEPTIIWHHACGKDKYEECMRENKKILKSNRILLSPFFEDIPLRMAAADLVISRAGAVTLTELSALGKASVLIPYPLAAKDHQTKNAEIFEERGAAIVIKEDALDHKSLTLVIKSMKNNRRGRSKYEENMHRQYVPRASHKIAKYIEKSL